MPFPVQRCTARRQPADSLADIKRLLRERMATEGLEVANFVAATSSQAGCAAPPRTADPQAGCKANLGAADSRAGPEASFGPEITLQVGVFQS